MVSKLVGHSSLSGPIVQRLTIATRRTRTMDVSERSNTVCFEHRSRPDVVLPTLSLPATTMGYVIKVVLLYSEIYPHNPVYEIRVIFNWIKYYIIEGELFINSLKSRRNICRFIDNYYFSVNFEYFH